MLILVMRCERSAASAAGRRATEGRVLVDVGSGEKPVGEEDESCRQVVRLKDADAADLLPEQNPDGGVAISGKC